MSRYEYFVSYNFKRADESSGFGQIPLYVEALVTQRKHLEYITEWLKSEYGFTEVVILNFHLLDESEDTDVKQESKDPIKAAAPATHINAKKAIDRLSKARNVQEIAASQLELLNNYYNETLRQARNSFLFASVSSVIGLIILIVALFLFFQGRQLALITATGGALTQFISGISFLLYKQTTEQMAKYREPLETMGAFLTANSICNELETTIQHQTRADLVRKMVGIEPVSALAHAPVQPAVANPVQSTTIAEEDV